MEAVENQDTTIINLNDNEVKTLAVMWSEAKKEAWKNHLEGQEFKSFMLGKITTLFPSGSNLRLYRGTTAIPVERNLASKRAGEFVEGEPGANWTTDIEKARGYSDEGGKLFQVDITVEELCDRNLVNATDAFDEFLLKPKIQKRAEGIIKA